jgi:hypothetical protein
MHSLDRSPKLQSLILRRCFVARLHLRAQRGLLYRTMQYGPVDSTYLVVSPPLLNELRVSNVAHDSAVG